MDLTMIKRVLKLLSAIPFCCGIPGVVSWDSRLIHNSTGVLGIDFEGTKFRRYIVECKAYPQKEVGRVE